ncbi:carboxymuconolactone decarboxylase family protein [Nocardia panacis]|uniref:Carboxymuconolactone decarboxylase family protein n=1 Tax=Nocardia panacis TaxID=2340916 RepID=A0A3A4KYZ3_9NOCA|nr:carboxymuconolactone decarboxylase family protein [Nocardia panacis]RJO74747.1 carboxymuconolactone decarboxylase family protein [Nocardia panacis]
MAYIDLGLDEHQYPGVRGLLSYRSDTGLLLSGLAEALLRGPSTLDTGERELIAAYVSSRNECVFCCSAHTAIAAVQIDGGSHLVDAAVRDPATAPVSAKLRALLAIAAAVQRSGRHVTAELVTAARDVGASDREIHDTVLIAAMFCLFNRYVDGLGTKTPTDPASYLAAAENIAAHGYLPEQARGAAMHR